MALTGRVVVDLPDPFRVDVGVTLVDLPDILCVVAGAKMCIVAGVMVVDLPDVL